MDFLIDQPPPSDAGIAGERELISRRIKTVKKHDLIVTSIIILLTSIVVAFVVYWLTGSIRFAAISAVTYPIISVVLSFLRIITNTGFRSATLQMIELNNSLISLKPIAEGDTDIEELCSKYKQIKNYMHKVKLMERDIVNGELAMFWEWDAGTQAKTAKARSFVNQAKKSIAIENKESASVEIEGFELDGESGEEK